MNQKDALLSLDGVSGVSERDGVFTIYVEADSESLRDEVRAILDGAPHQIVVSGAFRA